MLSVLPSRQRWITYDGEGRSSLECDPLGGQKGLDGFPQVVDQMKPMFKGVWSTAVNFVLVPPPDTKLAQYPPPDKRSDDSLGRHGLGGWAYCPRRSARASLA